MFAHLGESVIVEVVWVDWRPSGGDGEERSDHSDGDAGVDEFFRGGDRCYLAGVEVSVAVLGARRDDHAVLFVMPQHPRRRPRQGGEFAYPHVSPRFWARP